MAEQRNDPEAAQVGSGVETGSAPQPIDFPGADRELPGRSDGDEDAADGEPVD